MKGRRGGKGILLAGLLREDMQNQCPECNQDAVQVDSCWEAKCLPCLLPSTGKLLVIVYAASRKDCELVLGKPFRDGVRDGRRIIQKYENLTPRPVFKKKKY